MIVRTEAEYQTDSESTEDSPYLARRAIYGVPYVNVCEKITLFITARTVPDTFCYACDIVLSGPGW